MRAEKDGTGAGLVEHWNWAARKGLMNNNTAGALRAACSQVLAVEDGWENLDIRTIDPDDLLKRFENLRKKDFTPQSLATYGSRFRRAVKSYLAYLDGPQTWRFEGRDRSSQSERSRPRTLQKSPDTTGDLQAPEMVSYPFPVRVGVMAELVLPADLRPSEAKRLATFLESVSIGEAKELPPGSVVR